MIVGAYTGESRHKNAEKRWLRTSLPKYMMPDKLLCRSDLPRQAAASLTVLS